MTYQKMDFATYAIQMFRMNQKSLNMIYATDVLMNVIQLMTTQTSGGFTSDVLPIHGMAI